MLWLPLVQHFTADSWLAVLLLQSKVARTGDRATSNRPQFKAHTSSLRSTTKVSSATSAVSRARAEVLVAALCAVLHSSGSEVAFIWTFSMQSNEPALNLMSVGAKVLSAAAALLGSLLCGSAGPAAATPATSKCTGVHCGSAAGAGFSALSLAVKHAVTCALLTSVGWPGSCTCVSACSLSLCALLYP